MTGASEQKILSGSVSVTKGMLVYPYYIKDNTLTPFLLHWHGGVIVTKGVSMYPYPNQNEYINFRELSPNRSVP